jgi:hypothetical protein
MKKASIWAGIVGFILLGGNVYQGAKFIANPTSLPLVNIALNVTTFLWVILSIFLIYICLRLKHRDEASPVLAPITPNSSEDIERLRRHRNWIFGFFLISQFIGSAASWILNKYDAGFTLINIAVIFDVFINVIFLYFIIQLFLGKRDILNIFLYIIVIHILGLGIISILRGHWYGAFLGLVAGGYFVYAIKAPLNRKNYRIANFLLLPILIILSSAAPYFDNGKIPDLVKNGDLLEQQFFDESNNTSTVYNLFLQKEIPRSQEIRAVKAAIERRDAKLQEVLVNIDQLKGEYEKQIPNVFQKKTLAGYEYLIQTMNLNKAQGDKLMEFMQYAEKLDFSRLSEAELAKLSDFSDQVQEFNRKLTEVQFEWRRANLY